MSSLSQFFGSGVKSVQRGLIAWQDSNLNATATIAAVNMAKSVCFFGGSTTISNSSFMALVSLTNATTVTATRSQSGNYSDPGFLTRVSFTVVEYY